MSFRVLLVEDEEEIAANVAQGLQEGGYTVQRALSGHEAASALESTKWDLVILDWWLPGPDGITLLRTLRTTDQITPVLFLTARDAIQQRVEALRAGADDYLCKPFAFEEFLARVEALLRRGHRPVSAQQRFEDVVIDLAMNRVYRAGAPVALTTREQALLQFFLLHPGKDLSRATLYEHVWQDVFDGESNTLEVHIMELRRKLEALGPRIIHTVRGKGYRLGPRTSDDAS